jgi:hypothetical protein
VLTVCTIIFDMLKLWILPTECIFVFRLVLAINGHCSPKQHCPVGPSSGDVAFPVRCELNSYI